MPFSIRILTPGYWPLPPFSKANFNGKWHKLAILEKGEKQAKYAIKQAKIGKKGQKSAIKLKNSPIILEASITKALPKKLVVLAGKRRSVLSRWIGGIYSNINPRSLSQLRFFYDSIASIYRYHVEPERAHQLAAFADFIPKNAKVLDASAGDCTFAQVCGRHADVANADTSKNMLALAGKKIKKRDLFVASASKLPFEKNSFDVAVHTFSNIHSLDRKKFFVEFWRVLKPNGLLLYHPVKSPGEQWQKNFIEKTKAALKAAGFSEVRRIPAESKGKKKTTLVFYLARK